ncbi:transposase [Clostridium sp. JNZ J1-5]
MGKALVTKYDLNVKPRFDEIKQWVNEGLIDEEIADRLDVHVCTLGDYKKKHIELAKILERPSKWETNILPRLNDIREWCMEGLTNEEMSKRLDINPDTWYRYMKEHTILSELVQASKAVMDTKVENALLKTALGYEYEEIKTIIEEDKNGKKRTRIEKTKKYMPPNPAAQAFWLKNRKKDEWGDRKEIIFDTKAQEEERKRLFLQMINDEVIDADYSIEDEAVQEPIIIEEIDEGYIAEVSEEDYNDKEENQKGNLKAGA